MLQNVEQSLGFITDHYGCTDLIQLIEVDKVWVYLDELSREISMVRERAHKAFIGWSVPSQYIPWNIYSDADKSFQSADIHLERTVIIRVHLKIYDRS